MLSVRFVCLLVVLCASAQSKSLYSKIFGLQKESRVPDRYIVTLKAPKLQADKVQFALKALNNIQSLVSDAKIDRPLIFNSFIALSVSSKLVEKVEKLFSIPEVDSISADSSDVRISCTSQSTGDSLWGLSRVSSRDRPSYTRASYSYNTGNNDVTAYVLDTGIKVSHKDFEGRARHGFTASIFRSEGDDDLQGHGTHCAGTIIGKQYGAAKNAKAVAVKVLNKDGSGSISGIVEGLEFVLNDYQRLNRNGNYRAVASMSLGGGANPTLDRAVAELSNAGIPVVVAAGNEYSDACNVSPARESSAVTVGSTDKADALSWFSNYGRCVDILAPGSDILSAGIRSDTSSAVMSGTSMATPLVAGAVTRYLSESPQKPSVRDVKLWLDNSATKDKIDLNAYFFWVTNTKNSLLYVSC